MKTLCISDNISQYLLNDFRMPFTYTLNLYNIGVNKNLDFIITRAWVRADMLLGFFKTSALYAGCLSFGKLFFVWENKTVILSARLFFHSDEYLFIFNRRIWHLRLTETTTSLILVYRIWTRAEILYVLKTTFSAWSAKQVTDVYFKLPLLNFISSISLSSHFLTCTK